MALVHQSPTMLQLNINLFITKESYQHVHTSDVRQKLLTTGRPVFTTAGLPIRWTLGLRWYFCCRGLISNP